MTQKEKLKRADLLARQVRSIATRLEYDAKDYDVRFPLSYAEELREAAKEYLNLK